MRPASYLIGIGADAKTSKRSDVDATFETYIIGIQYLAPSTMSGYDTCKDASAGCKEACLVHAGHGGMIPKGQTISPVNQARIRRTKYLFENKLGYWQWLKEDIGKALKKASKLGVKLAVRLDGTSGLPWERMKDPETGKTAMELFPNVQFYDYTKSLSKMTDFLEGNFPSNYWLTFSRSEVNEPECLLVLSMGGNVSVPFANESYPETWHGYPTIDGTTSDLRFHDGRGVAVALCAKGRRAMADASGFIVR